MVGSAFPGAILNRKGIGRSISVKVLSKTLSVSGLNTRGCCMY